MSRRLSSGSNTLFNYFSKLSNNGINTKDLNESLNSSKTTPKKNTKEKRQYNSSDEENNDIVQPAKRVRKTNRIEDSDDSDNETAKTKTPKKLLDFSFSASDSNGATTPKKSKLPSDDDLNSSITTTPKTSTTLFDSGIASNSSGDDTGVWLHNRLEFLKPDNIRDIKKRRPSDPNYDRRTLFVPPDFLIKQTPAMRQWWIMKSEHFDCILFFKVGKFYELYHMDAVVGVQELGFSYMKGEFAHSGFPESAYGRMAATLIDNGYKVARVEQTETPDLMSERLKSTPGSNSKFDKVVRREICQITNKGTRVSGLQDNDIKSPMSLHLLAIIENQQSKTIEFGVCFVDTSIGKFYMGQYTDDCHYSRLLTMLAQYPPAVILEERKQLSSQTRAILKNSVRNDAFETLQAEMQFYSSTKTLEELIKGEYFLNASTGKNEFPDYIQQMLAEDDPLHTTCKSEYNFALRCLGACIWYLKYAHLDIQLLTFGKFEEYVPPDLQINAATSVAKTMVLDSCTLSSLNLIRTGSQSEMCLEKTLDHCCTPFGKRLLRHWICRPSCDILEIKNRQNAVTELVLRSDIVSEARTILNGLPDLERLLSKIHWMGNALRAKKHPDSRAIFYEEKTYSKRKVQDFTFTLTSFEKAMKLCELFADCSSELLQRYIVLNTTDSLFPDLNDFIETFKSSFNFDEAAKEGRIIPQYGIDTEYDRTIDEINEIKNQLDDYLKQQEKFFGCKITYTGTDKKRFQLEIPEHATRKVNHNYFLEGTKKGSKRYTTNETKSLLNQMIAAEARNKEVLQDLNRRVFERFSERYDDWNVACHCLAVIDVLISLAEYGKNQSVNMCVPDVLPYQSEPKLIIRDGYHPYVPNPESFVPNDTELGTGGGSGNEHARLLILTGPNMGGKSTLMRQVGLLAIMAQLGCYVPASEMQLTTVDRIFTRLGAHDDIMAGNSTFLVELREAATILNHSSPNSLVFLDELGRGTSTYDGTAIATAYVHHLIDVNCRAIFSTHYHSLVDYFRNNSTIQLGHMACKVESNTNNKNNTDDNSDANDGDDDDVTQENVIFMYKMIDGPCPKSYGFNAARLAGIPSSIIKRASQMSRKFEMETNMRKLFRKLFRNPGDNSNAEDIRNLLRKVGSLRF